MLSFEGASILSNVFPCVLEASLPGLEPRGFRALSDYLKNLSCENGRVHMTMNTARPVSMHTPSIYYAAETAHPKTNFFKAYAKFLELIEVAPIKHCALSVCDKSVFDDLPLNGFSPGLVDQLGSSRVILKGAALTLLTRRTSTSSFVGGPIFGIYVNLPQFKKLLDLPTSGIVYLPWERPQLDAFRHTYTRSVLI